MNIDKVLADVTDLHAMLFKKTQTLLIRSDDVITSVDILDDMLYIHLDIGLTQVVQLTSKYAIISVRSDSTYVWITFESGTNADVVSLDIGDV